LQEKSDMKVIVLAGGSGTRLWPLSREFYPKQFLKINSNESLLQRTVLNFLTLVPPPDLIIVTNKNYVFHVKSDLKEKKIDLSHIILEPVSKNTAPAIALAAKYCLEKLNCDPEEVILVSPSDHIIKPQDRFMAYISQGIKIAQKGYVVTFGVKPAKPETGYGYIKLREKQDNFYTAEAFIEKPDFEKAKKMVKSGNYYWNAGIFAFCLKTVLDEFNHHAPGIYRLLENNFEDLIHHFKEMPNISIDYAVMEKSDKLAVVPMNISWSDVGCWDALYEILEKDEHGNAKIGDILDIDTKNSLILGNKRLTATIGLEDALVIETDDAILIARKGETQKVRQIVKQLKKANRKEYAQHTTIYRPWGSFTILEEGNRYKIKKLIVYPGEKLSLQRHHHRSEHWIVVRGTAKVQIGDKEQYVCENESVYIPKTTLHRLENPGRINLELIEVQNGEYIGEDDIERFEDVYGRL